jgi:hypothetical protein
MQQPVGVSGQLPQATQVIGQHRSARPAQRIGDLGLCLRASNLSLPTCHRAQ